MIDSEGNQLGIVERDEALRKAENEGLDLVEVSPTAKPPVCRIMDFGKFRFEEQKRMAAQKKKQKQIQVKEVKVRPRIEDADFQVKMRNVRRFIEAGDKVKVSLRFRGREMAHQDLGMNIMERVKSELGEEASVEREPRLEGRQIIMVLAPPKK